MQFYFGSRYLFLFFSPKDMDIEFYLAAMFFLEFKGYSIVFWLSSFQVDNS